MYQGGFGASLRDQKCEKLYCKLRFKSCSSLYQLIPITWSGILEMQTHEAHSDLLHSGRNLAERVGGEAWNAQLWAARLTLHAYGLPRLMLVTLKLFVSFHGFFPDHKGQRELGVRAGHPRHIRQVPMSWLGRIVPETLAKKIKCTQSSFCYDLELSRARHWRHQLCAPTMPFPPLIRAQACGLSLAFFCCSPEELISIPGLELYWSTWLFLWSSWSPYL